MKRTVRPLPALALLALALLAGAGWLATLQGDGGGDALERGRGDPPAPVTGAGPADPEVAPEDRGGGVPERRVVGRDPAPRSGRPREREAVLVMVVRDDLGRPLERARFHVLRAWSPEPGWRPEGRSLLLTGERGTFRLFDLAAGPRVITVDPEPAGWPPGSGREELTLDLPHEGPPIQVVVTRVGGVRGRVVDADGAPVEGVTVTAASARESDRVESGKQGEFHLGALVPGRVRLGAEHGGIAARLEVTVDPGATLEGVLLALGRGGRIEGEVLDGDGGPVAEQDVVVLTDERAIARAQTDERGRFAVGPLASGAYTVVAPLGSKGDLFEQLLTADAQVVEGESSWVTLRPADRAPVEVFGRVTRAGEPAGDVQLFAFREGDSLIDTVRTAKSDEQGDYVLRLDGPGRVVFTLMSGGDPQPVGYATVPPVPRYRHDLVLPAGRISGRVLGPKGEPARFELWLEFRDAHLEMRIPGGQGGRRTQRDGRFDLTALPAGAYRLRARNDRWVLPAVPVDVGLDQHVSGLVLHAQAAGTLVGRVGDGDGTPVAGARVLVRDAEGTLAAVPVTSGGDGSFRVEGVPGGDLLVSAQTESRVAVGRVALAAGGSGRVELDLERGAVLEVTVRSADAPPSIRLFAGDGSEVSRLLSPTRQRASFSAVLDFGSRVFGPLPPGSYSVVASTPDGRSATQQVTLTADETLALELRL